MLLDGYGLVYRGYFALPPLTTSKGELVNGVFGFASIVLRGIQDLQPDYLAVSFDLPGPTFRHEAVRRVQGHAGEDAGRPARPVPQGPRGRQGAAHPGLRDAQGFEADDVIGTITRQLDDREDLETTIVTVDLDMLQLVTPRVRLMTTRSGVENTIMYDVARIDERFGLRPDQMIDYKALKGDPTDNIPGVPGVGEKTAAKLIREFGDLDSLLARLDEVTPAKLGDKLREHVDQIRMGRELSTIVRDLPIDFDLERGAPRRLRPRHRRPAVPRVRVPDAHRAPAADGGRDRRAADRAAPNGRPERLRARGARRRPAGRLGPEPDDGLAATRRQWRAPAPSRLRRGVGGRDPGRGGRHERRAIRGRPLRAGPRPARPRWPRRSSTRAGSRSAVPIAWPTSRPGWRRSRRSGSPSWPTIRGRGAGRPLALAVAGPDGRVVAADGPEAADALRHLLERLATPLVGHEVKPVLVAGFADDPEAAHLPVAFDTQVAAYVLNAALRSQTIADVVAETLDQILPPPAELPATARAGLEALSAIAVREPLERRLGEVDLERLFREVELPLIPVLARMEAVGVALDREALGVLEREFAAEISRLEAGIYHDVGHEFNLGSPKQLEQVLFFELDLPKGRKTKTGYSTDASVLEDLRPAHPMIDKLLEWRTYTKLRSTYVEALPTLIAGDGRLHTTFHQAVASTGRLSSSDPNLQNIPIRTELGRRIRRAFVAGDPSLVLLAADYSQVELRILAHVSGDEHLKDAFARGADIHRETAARVLHKDPADITHGERSMAKMVNFGLAYGMSDFGLASRANIPRAEAQEFINSYFAAYSGISYYMMAIKEQAKAQGWVETLLGRKRQIPELRASNPALRGAGERMAINMPIQGTAADIQKIAMIRVDERVRTAGLHARLLLSVHDELLLETPRDEVEPLAALVRETMEGALPLTVPLVVDIKVGDDWESITPLTKADAVAAEADEAPDLEAPLAPTLG